MGLRRQLKFAVCEVLQFTAFSVPIFMVMQRFALVLAHVKSQTTPFGGDASTTYWLIVAAAVAYVTTAALLVWLPMKYMVLKKKKALVGRRKWRPVALAFEILSTLPSFAFLIASSEVQIRNDTRLNTFTELPVSVVIFSLICIDIVERIRHWSLTVKANELPHDVDIPTLTTTSGSVPAAANAIGVATQNGVGRANISTPSMPEHSTVTPLPGNGVVRGLPSNGSISCLAGNPTVQGPPTNGGVPGVLGGEQGQSYGILGLCPRTGLPSRNVQSNPQYKAPHRFLMVSDVRADAFTDSFLYWLDTAELVRMVSHTPVCFSSWVVPVYLLSFLSTLRIVLMPHSPLLSSLGVALQDLPFLFLRVGLIATFGFITPVLYVLKNLLVCLAYIYFNFMARLKIFNT